VLALQQLAHALAIGGGAHQVTGTAELLGEQLADIVVVIDDQQSMHAVGSLHAAIIPCRELNRISWFAYVCFKG